MSLNPESIRPQWDKVLVRQEKPKAKTQGGIYLPDESRDRNKMQEMIGEVVTIGDSAFKELYHGDKPPSVGDTVIFKRYSGNNFIDQFADSDEFAYRLIDDTDIVAVVDGDK